jgi:hypothetical protein
MSMPTIVAGTSTRCQAITDIIESVALEQAAISHILNAEGEKIQKAVCFACNVEQMIQVNRSVKSMVNAITRLEIVLQAKLDMFQDCLCRECMRC